MKDKYNLRFLLFNLLIVFGFNGCSNPNADSEFEFKVLNKIFNDLVSKMYVSTSYPKPPKPPRPILNENDSIIGYDTIEYQAYLQEYKQEITNLELDTNKIVLAIYDSLFTFTDYNNCDDIIKYEKSKEYTEALKSIYCDTVKNIKIKLDDIKSDERYILKYYSDFPQGRKIWDTKFDFKFAGVMHLSKIYFNDTKKFGVLYCSYSCGKLCGYGNFVFIKNVNNKWVIDKLIRL